MGRPPGQVSGADTHAQYWLLSGLNLVAGAASITRAPV